MASLTITSPFPTRYSARASVGTSSRSHTVMVMASTRPAEAYSLERAPLSAESEKGSRGRRELVFAAAAVAAAAALTRPAVAEDEPKRGTSEAKKKYAPVCVTNPTARICRN